VVVTGTAPDRYTRQLRDAGFDTVLFLDAVEFGAAPGSVALFNSGEMRARFPQVSTHKLSLGLLAQLIEANGRTRVWLLGVQPGSLAAGSVLSEAVENTQGLLVGLFPGIGTLPVHSTRDPVDKGDRPEACSTDPEAGEWRDGEERRQASAFSPLPSALPC
jgi:hydrogenase maturation protease